MIHQCSPFVRRWTNLVPARTEAAQLGPGEVPALADIAAVHVERASHTVGREHWSDNRLGRGSIVERQRHHGRRVRRSRWRRADRSHGNANHKQRGQKNQRRQGPQFRQALTVWHTPRGL